MRPKAIASPSAGVEPFTVTLNCGAPVGQSVVPPAAPEIVQISPVVEDPVTCHLLSELLYVMKIIWLTAFASLVELTVAAWLPPTFRRSMATVAVELYKAAA